MEPVRQQGTLTKWNDERGFGFIRPQEGGREVFLHISDVKSVARRPRVGDTLLYLATTQENGKIRASHASIVGLTAPVVFRRKHSQKVLGLILGVLGIVVAALFHPIRTRSANSHSDWQSDSGAPLGYSIKGNISVETGDKIYHVLGSDDYAATKIDPDRGERWFRTEEDAQAKGWRKSPR